MFQRWLVIRRVSSNQKKNDRWIEEEGWVVTRFCVCRFPSSSVFFTRTNDDKKINKNIVFEQFYVYVIHWGFVTNVDTRNMKVDESVLYGVELFDKLKLCSNISYHRWISPLYTTYFIEHLAQFNNRNRWIVTCLLLSIRAIIDVLVLLFSIFLSASCTTITVTLPLWSRHQRKFSVHIRNW